MPQSWDALKLLCYIRRVRSMWGRLTTCAAVDYRRRPAANAAVGRLTIGRSLPSCPTRRVYLAMQFSSSTALLTVMICIASYGFSQPASSPAYDLLLQGGHVIDPKNGISAVRDVAIKDGFIAAGAAHL